jgi:hypothetical protein
MSQEDHSHLPLDPNQPLQPNPSSSEKRWFQGEDSVDGESLPVPEWMKGREELVFWFEGHFVEALQKILLNVGNPESATQDLLADLQLLQKTLYLVRDFSGDAPDTQQNLLQHLNEQAISIDPSTFPQEFGIGKDGKKKPPEEIKQFFRVYMHDLLNLLLPFFGKNDEMILFINRKLKEEGGFGFFPNERLNDAEFLEIRSKHQNKLQMVFNRIPFIFAYMKGFDLQACEPKPYLERVEDLPALIQEFITPTARDYKIDFSVETDQELTADDASNINLSVIMRLLSNFFSNLDKVRREMMVENQALPDPTIRIRLVVRDGELRLICEDFGFGFREADYKSQVTSSFGPTEQEYYYYPYNSGFDQTSWGGGEMGTGTGLAGMVKHFEFQRVRTEYFSRIQRQVAESYPPEVLADHMEGATYVITARLEKRKKTDS